MKLPDKCDYGYYVKGIKLGVYVCLPYMGGAYKQSDANLNAKKLVRPSKECENLYNLECVDKTDNFLYTETWKNIYNLAVVQCLQNSDHEKTEKTCTKRDNIAYNY